MAASASQSPIPLQALKFLYHHVFLPPEVPQSNDFQAEFDLALMKIAEEGLGNLKNLISVAQQGPVIAAKNMLKLMRRVHEGGDIEATQLLKSFPCVLNDGVPIALHVRAQNAGVLISKAGDEVHISVFELSPLNEAATATKGRLWRTFPAASVAISKREFENKDLQQTLAESLSTMSSHDIVGMKPKVSKAGQLHDEDRDTTHPGMVTEVLSAVVAAIGRPTTVSSISKNTREEVRWKDTRSPWRRSPTWLLIRVALQLTLSSSSGASELYKQAMLLVMCEIEKHALMSSFGSDALYVMNAKIAQRVLKLGIKMDRLVTERIQRSTTNVHHELENRWRAVLKQNSHKLDLSALAKLDFEHDTFASLPELDTYIDAMGMRRNMQQAMKSFKSLRLLNISPGTLPSLSDISSNPIYALANLQAFEDWVANCCGKWAESQSTDAIAKSTKAIGNLIEAYHTHALRHYANNPESLSVMLLTIFELWIACDRAVVAAIPMLKDYEPGLDKSILQNLLLPFKSQMDRLARVEAYLRSRSSKASHSCSELFVQIGTPDSFAVKYFDNCSEMQDTRKQVLECATKDRQAKKAELRNKQQEYAKLMDQYNSAECEYHEVVVQRVNRFTKTRMQHRRNCTKCSYKSKAAQIQIEVHEWPLPGDELRAKAVVFELRVPDMFASWRDTSIYVVKDVLRAEQNRNLRPRVEYKLSTDKHLQAYHVSHATSNRCTLVSEDKPNIGTHRKLKSAAMATENDVCVNNGSKYKYHDKTSSIFLYTFTYNEDTANDFTYTIPKCSKALRKYIFRPASAADGPPPNRVIADQTDCPDHMSLEEYKELGNLPLGHRIQWYNLLLQLRAPTIDFRKDETALIMFQCIYQTGPCGDGNDPLRASHLAIGEGAIAQELVDSVNAALSRVKENWESAQSLCIFSVIIRRLLSLSDITAVQQRCMETLKDLRNVSFGWLSHVRDRMQKAESHNERAELRSKCVEVALICSLTFDVDDIALTGMLCSAKNTSILVQCCVVIQEAKKTFSQTSDPIFSLLEHRYRKLMRRCCTTLCTAISALDDAIKKAWPAFQPSNTWTAFEGYGDHWVITSSAASSFEDALAVHYNTLTGELLVNGLPLDRPPKKYEDHPRWPTMFGRTAIEVMPTIVPGMQFSLKQKYQEYEVHVGMERTTAGEDLIVQATLNGSTYTLVPARLLEGHFPKFFVEDFVHWFNHKDRTLEFRPKCQPWERDPTKIWTLAKLGTSSTWQLTLQQYAVIKSRSKTAKEIGAVLQPLAIPSCIQIILNPFGTSIEIELPQLELGFSLHSGTSSIHSREFRGMTIDDDQSMTTLSGFSSKLLLRSQADGQRTLLLAEGSVSCAPADNHVKASVSRPSIVKVHPLVIDHRLGRLIDNGDLQCKLFLAYLHGLTSFCLPDPLTSKTGTEECLTILQSAAVQSFDQLSTRNIDTLQAIAGLSPVRTFYPANERVMQKISFSAQVGPLAQHNGLFKAARFILRRAEKYALFYPESRNLRYSLPNIDEHLLERDSIRSATFRVSGFGAEDFNASGDVVYRARDTAQSSDRARNSYALATTVYGSLSSRHWDNAMPNDLLWAASKNAKTVTSLSKADKCVIKFDPRSIASGFDFTQWLALHQTAKLGHSGGPSKYDLMMWLAALSNFKGADLAVLQTIALTFTARNVRDETIPEVETCFPSEGYIVLKSQVQNIVQSNLLDVGDSPEGELEPYDDDDMDSFLSRRDKLFSDRQNHCAEVVTARVWQQWPSPTVSIPNFSDQPYEPSRYVNISSIMETAKSTYKLCYNNLQLFKYFARIQEAVTRLSNVVIPAPVWPTRKSTALVPHQRSVSLNHVLAMAASILPQASIEVAGVAGTHSCGQEFPRLLDLTQRLKSVCGSTFEESYVKELEESIKSLVEGTHYQTSDLAGEFTLETLLDYRAKCQNRVDALYNAILAQVKQGAQDVPGAAIPHSSTLWPRIAPTTLLRLLNRHHWPELKQDWKTCIIEFGLAISTVQRADRLLRAVKSPNKDDLVNEIANPGHVNWNPHEHPETLLLEIESAFLVREVQEDIALEMRIDERSRNAVLQLNMGEGKSSVIVPMVATSLADTSQLVRVIVAKPQSKQMWQMLVSKLGGLIDRRVRLMPFSRSLKLSAADADAVGDLVRNCMSRGDVLLVQPEHILSFRLMVLECFESSAKQDVGKSLLETQLFFDRHSRDVVDETDENFSTKFELIYTMGNQRQIDFSPNRWICVQQILDLVRRFGPQVATEHPGSVEINKCDSGMFPRLRILKLEAAERLVSLIATHICETGIEGFPIVRQAKTVRDAVFKYLVEFKLSEDEIAGVEDATPGSFWDSAPARSALLLIRGLLAGGILAFAFAQKRWRVNYGLSRLAHHQHNLRHPDVVLVFTSLSYYYEGLTNDDLFTALKHLMRSDQADAEYGAWVADAPNMPFEFRSVEGINLRDTIQCTMDIFPNLRYGKAVIDYFLANIVFPKAMKEFPHKLSASGWDIGMKKARPTTGFSGTIDSKPLLPLDVEHLDLPRQKHTNALVLDHILDPSNAVLLMRNTASRAKSEAESLLDIAIQQDLPVQVILDVGAQVLEFDNYGLAKRWLEIHPGAGDAVQAVVFVNDEDELSVLDRRGRVERLQTSSYASRLDECLIFLDEAHTRGIDLKLPKHYRAAVTLGANLTKDRLVQACMRMRQLGKGQTVLFCVNEEIEGRMRALVSKLPPAALELSDVLLWSISETFKETRRAMPLWAVQGERFLTQSQHWNAIHTTGVANMSKALFAPFLEPEAQTLEDRYRPRSSEDVATRLSQSSVARMEEITDRCSQFCDLQFHSGALQEEQERELSPEIEQERQVERRSRAPPSKHTLHADVVLFVKSGKIKQASPAYMPAFQALRDTTAAARFKVSQLGVDDHLLVSADFAKTVEKANNSSYTSDSFQRSVQWILACKTYSPGSLYLMIISPYEAEKLMATVSLSSKVSLHLYKPRCVIGHPTFDKLDFMSIPAHATTHHIPRSLQLQLDVFAGQLYLNSYEDYLEVCRFLGLAATPSKDGEIIAADGFIIRDNSGRKPGSSPVQFLQALMSQIRRNGQGIGKTDMGYILEGKILEKSHFEGRGVDAA